MYRFFKIIFVCVYIHVWVCTYCGLQVEITGQLQASVFSFHHVAPVDQAQVMRLGGKSSAISTALHRFECIRDLSYGIDG